LHGTNDFKENCLFELFPALIAPNYFSKRGALDTAFTRADTRKSAGNSPIPLVSIVSDSGVNIK
jgi:hypothetical protein